MVGNGRADSSGAGLVVTMEGGWTLILRKTDFKPDAAFPRYFGAEIRAQDLRTLLPNWQRLTWARLPKGSFYAAEASARDGDYLVNIQAASSGDKDVDALIQLFQSFMKGLDSAS